MIHRIAKDEAQQRGFYRLLSNPRLETGHIVSYMQQDCQRQVEPGAHYLAIQDTSQPNFEHNRANIHDTQQLGVIGDNASLGFFLHPVLVVQAESGRCIGFSDVLTWSRVAGAPGKQERGYKTLPIEEKESYRWLQAATTSSGVLGAAGLLTHICDREGDIGELFARVPQEGKVHVLVRSSADRRLAGGQVRLSTLLAGLAPAGEHSLLLRGDVRTGRQQRQARLEVRHSPATLQLGQLEKALYVVEVTEKGAPAGQKPLYWRLLTTHPVDSLRQALQVVEWYSQRWNIEQVFRLLKQKGMNVESLELESGKALVQLTLLALFAVAKIMLLHLASRQEKPQPVADAFTQQEMACMAAVNQKYEGNTQKQKNPYQPDTLQWCYWVLARLGGWKPHEKKAGVITLQRGYMDFIKIYHGWQMAIKLVS